MSLSSFKPARPNRRDAVVVLRAAGAMRGVTMAKTWGAEGNEFKLVASYPLVKWFDMEEVCYEDLRDFGDKVIEPVTDDPSTCFVRGGLVNPNEPHLHKRRLLIELHPEDGVLTRDTSSTLIALDFDKLRLPADVSLMDREAIVGLALASLPEEFREADFIWQLTSSHLVSGTPRLRLYLLADIALHKDDLDTILSDAPVDPACFRPSQITYIVPPGFVGGASDPVDVRFGYVESRSERVEVGPLLERANAQQAFSGRQYKEQKGRGGGKARPARLSTMW